MSKKIKLLVEVDESTVYSIRTNQYYGSKSDLEKLIINGTPITEGDLISRQDVIDVLEEQLDYLRTLNKNENPTAEGKWYGVNWARNTIADLPYKQNERPQGEFTRQELESWLYQIAFNNTDNELSRDCEEIISRLDGFERFVADMRGDENE